VTGLVRSDIQLASFWLRLHHSTSIIVNDLSVALPNFGYPVETIISRLAWGKNQPEGNSVLVPPVTMDQLEMDVKVARIGFEAAFYISLRVC
jgi:hypothetical protein